MKNILKTKSTILIKAGTQQSSMDNFLSPSTLKESTSFQKYRYNHSRQIAINNGIAKELIVGCSLPLNFVENPNFRKFVELMEPRYRVCIVEL